jgi:hypothetical protein
MLYKALKKTYLEKAFTALTGSDPVVLAGGIVATYSTQHALPLWRLVATDGRRSR